VKVWDVIVIRKRSWTFSVEAETEEDAKFIAEDLARKERPSDDWAYDTTATECYGQKPSKLNT